MANGDVAADYYLRQPERPLSKGRLFVVSGPSGVGKDTVIEQFLPMMPGILLNVSATTRPPRPGESEGDPYFFVSVADFRTMVEMDSFLEYARVNGNLYGTPRAWVEEQRGKGIDVLLKIDVQGGLTVRTKVRDAVLIFLMPPSVGELERRLRSRSTETEEQITTRLLDARSELQQIPNYDYAVMNDDVHRAADLLRAIFLAERCRVRHEGSDGSASVPWTAPHTHE
ncbi:MAG: guanylate kinase [Cytophagales bacterium]|nr:guanylate kinase [Armatimonadota bacterium]